MGFGGGDRLKERRKREENGRRRKTKGLVLKLCKCGIRGVGEDRGDGGSFKGFDTNREGLVGGRGGGGMNHSAARGIGRYICR